MTDGSDQTLNFASSLCSPPIFDYKGLKQLAERDGVPIVSMDIGYFLNLLVRLRKPKKILEIGSGYGCSTLFMITGNAEARLLTIDGNDHRTEFTRKQVLKNGFEDRVAIRNILATNFFKENESTFDMIFLDSMKKEYEELLEPCVESLNQEGILVADNVFFKGQVSGTQPLKKQYLATRKKLQLFIEKARNHPSLDTYFYNIGDGLLTAIKK